MRSNRVALVALLALLVAAPTQAAPPETFRASITEEFTQTDCFDPAQPPAADLCGTAKTHGQGKAITATNVTVFDPLPSGCFRDVHTTTLTFKQDRGSLVLDIDGTLCPTGGGNFTFDGTYAVAGGTGTYAGATGEGTISGGRQDGPVISDLTGSLATD
jgi:hypothetical protein